MNVIAILEQLASHAHHNLKVKELLDLLPNEIKEAFLAKDKDQLKILIGGRQQRQTEFAMVVHA